MNAYTVMILKQTIALPNTHNEELFLAHLQRQVANGDYRRPDIFHPALTELFEFLITHMLDIKEALQGDPICDIVEGGGELFNIPRMTTFTPQAQAEAAASRRPRLRTYKADADKIMDQILIHAEHLPLTTQLMHEALAMHALNQRRLPLLTQADEMTCRARALHQQRETERGKLQRAINRYKNSGLPADRLTLLQYWLIKGYTISECQRLTAGEILPFPNVVVAGVDAWWQDIQQNPLLSSLRSLVGSRQSNSIRRTRVIKRLLSLLASRNEGLSLMKLVWPDTNPKDVTDQEQQLERLTEEGRTAELRQRALERTVARLTNPETDFDVVCDWCITEATTLINGANTPPLSLAA